MDSLRKLIHVINDAYRFFRVLEEATYELLQDGISKQGAISQVVGNPAVGFYWDLITDGLKKIGHLNYWVRFVLCGSLFVVSVLPVSSLKITNVE